MGWFSSKTKVYVATSVSRVIADKMLPDSVKAGVLRGILAEGADLFDSLQAHLQNGLAVKADQMFRYARDHYTYGLPVSVVLHENAGHAAVKACIEAIEARTVDIEYAHYGAFNNLHYGWQHLHAAYGYDGYTNELTVLSAEKGAPVYLTDLRVVIPASRMPTMNPMALEAWGTAANRGYSPLNPGAGNRVAPIPGPLNAPSPVIVDAQASTETIRVEYCWLAGGAIQTASLDFAVPDDTPDYGYFQVKYYYPDSDRTVYRWFTYRDESGTYPALDAVFSSPANTQGEFFPFIYFRLNSQRLSADKTSAAYKSAAKALSKLGINFDDLDASIHQTPDVDHVQQAILTLAVPANSQAMVEQRYLFDFFSRLHNEIGSTAKLPAFTLTGDWLDKLGQYGFTPFVTRIGDAGYTMSLECRALYKTTIAGAIGAIGHYTSEVRNFAMTEMQTQWVRLNADDPGAEPEYGYRDVPVSVDVPVHLFRKQVTAGLYAEVRVVGLQTIHWVAGEHATIQVGSVDTLLVPVDRSLVQAYPLPVKETLYGRALNLIINSKQEVKIRWYQQGWFQVVLIIIAIVMFCLGDGGSTLSAVLAAGEYTAAAWIILVAIVEMYVFQQLFKFIVKLISPEFAMLLAIIAMLAGAYDVFANGGIEGAPWAETLLQTSTGLSKASSDVLGDMLLGVKSEAEAFGTEVQQDLKLLEETSKLLEGQNILSPVLFVGEKPDEYYSRTIHSGNIGVLSIDAISMYVESRLMLPQSRETIGDYV